VRVLVYPHTMEIGGSQLNAVEIGAAVRDRGHEVTVVSRPGVMVETVQKLGLPHIPLDPRAGRTLSPRAIGHLTSLVKEHRIDVVHGYEWPPGVEAVLGPRLRLGVPVVCTVMSGSVAPFLPRTMPLIVGTDELRCDQIAAGRPSVTLIEPPVDVRANTPEFDPGPFRADLGLDAGVPLLVVACRLSSGLKLQGVLVACDAVGELARAGLRVQLAVVGDGLARQAAEEAAAAANSRAGHLVVALTGQLSDPRPAYAAADIVLGMGGSALRGMAFGKPLIVQGVDGFFELVTPESAPEFLHRGWGGTGSDADWRPAGAARLAGILRTLLADPGIWTKLGQYGRRLVVERFSLDHAAAVQEEVYVSTTDAANRPGAARLAADAAWTGQGALRHKARRRVQRWRGTVAIEDFNVTVSGALADGRAQ
jgi:glycosyltransferase involved in cell wall biosynthesis